MKLITVLDRAAVEQWSRGGRPTHRSSAKPGPQTRPIADRFWPRVQFTDSCWFWQGSHTRHGTGVFPLRAGRAISARRVAWWLVHGRCPPPRLDATCVQPGCCNPFHAVPAHPRAR